MVEETKKDQDAGSIENTRREYLKGSAGAVLPFTFSSFQSKKTDKIKIVTQKNKDGVEKREEVPRSWYQRVKAVRRAQKALKKRYANTEGIVDIVRSPAEERFGDKRGLKISVEIDPASFKGTLPSSESGIPVATREVKEGVPLSCDGFTGNINPARGGIACSGEQDGTLALGVNKSSASADDLVLTASHLWGDCEEAVVGSSMYQGGNKYGTVAEHNVDNDWAIVDGADGTFGDEESTGKIRDENGDWPVDAWYNQNGLDNLASSETETVYSMGTTTGQTEGTVKNAGVGNTFSGCVTYDDKGVNCELKNAEGDSGGPIYNYNDDGTKAVMVGMNSWGSGYDGKTSCRGASDLQVTTEVRGPSFDHLADQFNIYPK